MDYHRPRPPSPTRKPLSERINLRLIVFLLVVALPFLWCLWMIVDQRIIVNEGDYYAVDLKGMGNFPFDAAATPRTAIPKEVRELNGKKVQFEGEMYAPEQASDRREAVPARLLDRRVLHGRPAEGAGAGVRVRPPEQDACPTTAAGR